MMIECRNLSLKYKDGHTENLVLNEINLKIQDGENVVLLGPSGSGKSSLIYLLSGLKRPTSGKVLFNGIDVTIFNQNTYSNLRRENYGYIFQFHFLIPYLSVIENILVGAPNYSKKYRERAHTILKDLNIGQYSNKRIYELSGGERQRVAIARSLISEPKVIFADEPTASLDHNMGVEIINILKKYVKSTTLIMATHDTSILNGDESIIKIENHKAVRI